MIRYFGKEKKPALADLRHWLSLGVVVRSTLWTLERTERPQSSHTE